MAEPAEPAPLPSGPHEGQGLWVFGYGSLLWRPGFAYVARVSGHVRGWARRLWQGCEVHRGVPGAPGRVATLVPDPGNSCFGLAYRVAPGHEQAVLAQLDSRERGGYERHWVPFEAPTEGAPPGVLLYVASQDNPAFLGPDSAQAIAAQVARSRGPSGDNRQYVERLDRILRELGQPDPHIQAIVSALARLR